MIQARPVNAHRVVPLIWANLEGNPILPPGCTREKFTQGLAGTRCLGFFHGNELIGCATFRQRIFLHVDVLPAWRGKWFSPALAKTTLDYGFAQSPALVALIEPHDEHVIRMARFVGFTEVDRTELAVSLGLDRATWARKAQLLGLGSPTPAIQRPAATAQRHSASSPAAGI